MGRLILVGEAPGGKSGSLPGPALDVRGATGKRLSRMMKLTPEEFMALDRRNLFDTTDEGRAWDRYAAARRAWRMTKTFEDGDRVILLGGRVADAFGLRDYPRFVWMSINPEDPLCPVDIAIIPHPSGRNRAYNDPAIYDEATAFLRRATHGR